MSIMPANRTSHNIAFANMSKLRMMAHTVKLINSATIDDCLFSARHQFLILPVRIKKRCCHL